MLQLSNFDPVLKDFWGPAIANQLNNDITIWNLTEESSRSFSGRRCIYPIHTTRNSGVGGRAENGTLPVAGNQGHELAVVSATYQYGTIRLSGPTIAAGKHAWAEALSMEMEGLVNDIKVDWARQLYGDGTGRLAQITTSATAGSGSVVVPVQNRFQRPGQPGARYISVGQIVDIGSIANAAGGVSQTVSAVTVSTNLATTTDSITLGNSGCTFSSSQQWIYNNGAGVTGGVGIEMMGLLGIADVFTEGNMWGSNAFWSANLFGVARSSVTSWNAIVLGNSGVARIADSLVLQTACDEVHQATGEEIDQFICHHAVARAIFDSMVSDRRFATTVFNGGYSELSYQGVVIKKDRMAPYNTLLGFKRSSLERFNLMSPQWIDKDGSILARDGNRTDSYEGWFGYYGNMGVVGNMKTFVAIRDIKVDF